MKLTKTHEAGQLYQANSFVVVVVEGTQRAMGAQYGALMVEHMDKAWNVLGKDLKLTDEDKAMWLKRTYKFATNRMRQWYDGVVEGSGWTLEKVCLMDSIFEIASYNAEIHTFGGCSSAFSWGKHSVDGNMYVGRNFDWFEDWLKFPTVLTVTKPSDGTYKIATAGYPGMYMAWTAVNEHGAYTDAHDGSSMGGNVIYMGRPSTLQTIFDILGECDSKDALKARLHGVNVSISCILSIADNEGAGSFECSGSAGTRYRAPDAGAESYTVVNSFLEPSWGMGLRETVSNSLRRHKNSTDRLAERAGKMDAKAMCDLFDMNIFNEDGSFKEGGFVTKPSVQDADLTNYTMVTDIKRLKIWLKCPVTKPAGYYDNWTEVDLKQFWG